MEQHQMPPMLTVPDIKNYLRIGRVQAYELIKRELFPSIRIGRDIRIPRDAFLRWADGLQENSGAVKNVISLPRAANERRL
jgi:excisionase family DNA binding protein